ncbi:hypothetical protein [Aestuariimicrobium ganziense]|uniref:hypothetical protein n=1 Tax=Aestuariimicrobium ganziense TaxID=2773677 RepID=UPI001942CB97|nr:hypothetical protein [Aestuariimicrobium ganziense]
MSSEQSPQVVLPNQLTITKDNLTEAIRGGQPLPFWLLAIMIALAIVPIGMLINGVSLRTIATIALPLVVAGILPFAILLRRMGSRSRSLAKRAFPVGATVTSKEEKEAFELHTPAGTIEFPWEDTKADTLNHVVLLRREDGLRLAVPKALVPPHSARRFGRGFAAQLSRYADRENERAREQE